MLRSRHRTISKLPNFSLREASATSQPVTAQRGASSALRCQWGQKRHYGGQRHGGGRRSRGGRDWGAMACTNRPTEGRPKIAVNTVNGRVQRRSVPKKIPALSTASGATRLWRAESWCRRSRLPGANARIWHCHRRRRPGSNAHGLTAPAKLIGNGGAQRRKSATLPTCVMWRRSNLPVDGGGHDARRHVGSAERKRCEVELSPVTATCGAPELAVAAETRRCRDQGRGRGPISTVLRTAERREPGEGTSTRSRSACISAG